MNLLSFKQGANVKGTLACWVEGSSSTIHCNLKGGTWSVNHPYQRDALTLKQHNLTTSSVWVNSNPQWNATSAIASQTWQSTNASTCVISRKRAQSHVLCSQGKKYIWILQVGYGGVRTCQEPKDKVDLAAVSFRQVVLRLLSPWTQCQFW